MPKKFLWPIIIIVLALLAALLTGTNSSLALRPYLLFLFISICPGMAIVRLLRLNDVLAEVVLAVALSLALGAFVAEILVLSKHWSPPMVLAVLIGISFIGAILQIITTAGRGATMRQLDDHNH